MSRSDKTSGVSKTPTSSVARRLRAAAGASARAMLGAAAPARGRGGQFDLLETRVMMSANDVVINEIMFNSSSLETADEYVELYNKGPTAVNLSGFRLAKGVDYAFANNQSI